MQKKETLMFIYIFDTHNSSLICTFNLQVDMHISNGYIQTVFITDCLTTVLWDRLIMNPTVWKLLKVIAKL